jgi:hypothetical protein
MARMTRKPKVFIVSSSEKKTVSEVVRGYLRTMADVTPWYLPEVWQKPGSFILQVLLEHAPNYDFAVIVFEPDDRTISRGKEAGAPRDNVIFEAGMFMSHLGQKRTFIIAPKDQDLKVLSDLAGLILLSYDQPTPESGWKGALEPVAKTIFRELKSQRTREPLVAARPGPANFGDAHAKVNALLDHSRESKKPITVLNIALDMELTWGVVLCERVLNHRWPGGLHWRSLMVDHDTTAVDRENAARISLETAKHREQEMVKYCTAHRAELKKKKNITFECRAYSSPPPMHGFAIGSELYVGFCWAEGGQVACAPYLYFSDASEDITMDHVTGAQYMALFNGAFAQIWKTARPVWPEHS